MSGAYAQILLRWFHRTWFVLIYKCFFRGVRTYATNSGPLGASCSTRPRPVAQEERNDTRVIARASKTVALATVMVGITPKGVAITPDGTNAYATNAGSNNVCDRLRATNTVVATDRCSTLDEAQVYVANK